MFHMHGIYLGPFQNELSSNLILTIAGDHVHIYVLYICNSDSGQHCRDVHVWHTVLHQFIGQHFLVPLHSICSGSIVL